MKIFIIDGNNLIGKHRQLSKIQRKDKQLSREKLASILETHYRSSRNKIFLHLDGFEKDPIYTSKIKIIYSNNKTADDNIRAQIENIENRKIVTVVSSDGSLVEFGRVCRCEVVKSEDFADELLKDDKDEEKLKIDMMKNDLDEFKKLFKA